jgi:hypothetical protein
MLSTRERNMGDVETVFKEAIINNKDATTIVKLYDEG